MENTCSNKLRVIAIIGCDPARLHSVIAQLSSVDLDRSVVVIDDPFQICEPSADAIKLMSEKIKLIGEQVRHELPPPVVKPKTNRKTGLNSAHNRIFSKAGYC